MTANDQAQKFSVLELSLLSVLFAWQLSFFWLELQDPGAVPLLVQGVPVFIIRLALLPHPPEDLQPALRQAA